MAALSIRIARATALDPATSSLHGGASQAITLEGAGTAGLAVSLLLGDGVTTASPIPDVSGHWTFATYADDGDVILASQSGINLVLVIPALPVAASDPQGLVAEYLALVQPQHRARPRFLASMLAVMQPLADLMGLMAAMPRGYDLDEAAGKQLDRVGVWVGVSRTISIPITGVFFAWGTANVGWGQGNWRGPFDNLTSSVTLDDATYRMLLRARIAANHWDGTLSGAADAYGYIFNDPNTNVFIQDNQDHTFTLNISGTPLSTLQMSMLTGGYLPIRPVGVRLAAVNVVSVAGSPLFGWGESNALIAGWGTGAWPVAS